MAGAISPEHSYIFVATTGRSGTNQLVELLNCCDGVGAEHEPEPQLNGRPLRWLMKERPGAGFLFPRWKASRIAERRTRLGCQLYGDISHLFIKAYPGVVSLLDPSRCVVVWLRREPEAVIKSFYEIACIPGEKWGNHWLGNPAWPGAAFKLTPENDYEAVAWHVLETELRAKRFRAESSKCLHLELDFKDLVDPETMHAWLTRHGLRPNASFDDVAKRRANDKAGQKVRRADPAEIARAMKRLAAL